MHKSLATVSISGTLEEKLTAIARAGFDGVEIFESDLVNCALGPEEIGARVRDLGLTVDLYQPFRDFEGVPDDLFARNLRRAERKFDVMERLGAPTMLVCSSVHPAAVDDDARAAAQLRTLAERAHARGLRVAYEALAWGRHVNDYRHSAALVAAADHPHLGVCLDSFHILSRSTDLAHIREIPAEKLFFVQLADAPRLAMDVLSWSRHHRCFPGQGDFDLTGFTGHVLAAGYRGPLSLEVFNDTFRQADAGRTAADALRSLLLLEESVGRFATGAAAGERVELFRPPEPAPAGAFAFVELAADPAAPAALSRTLTALGFRETGTHRTKPATLWENGEARIVVHTGRGPRPDGPSLAAVGLSTPDLDRAAARAAAFRARPDPGTRGPGEAALPALATDGPLEVLLCAADAEGRTWRTDFGAAPGDRGPGPATDTTAAAAEGDRREAAPGPRTGPARARGVDHVTAQVPFDRYDEETLFLRAVLGLHPADSQELADPYGLVRSRAFTTAPGRGGTASPAGADAFDRAGGTVPEEAGRGVRIALNTPHLGAHPSPATQHAAFACDDVLAAARAARDAGLAPLAIPDNYYEDLAARWDLPGDRIAELRSHSVLYDRDEDGEFLHFYTPMVGRHLFFEMVQRIGGYRGFGAANAPARMSAQHAG
ncbi:TIM barrel protein [Streptomyces sp. NPDC059740]|uniref:sugar phosphate isomerase/epimerase and 4-hydroxyphenylpyruvate domain-containing protein n=1 Tax=Streptomyces sp. NPDC059740 TaxID=3346926 RepID=UPI003651F364